MLQKTASRSIPTNARLLTAQNLSILAVFSLIYFATVLLRASEKYFWFDELGTVNISRLPNMNAVWQTIRHGMDYNPPLFWVLTRLAGAPFGFGLISARLPEMIGFWVACICLFAIAARRFGSTCGVIAMLFPLVTAAKYYAYEARPHGIVLGFAAIAALAWQEAHESRRRVIWLVVLGASLTAADLTHPYAVMLYIPLGLAELYRTTRTRRLDWGVLCSIGISGLVAAPFLIYIVRIYRQVVDTAGTNFPPVSHATVFSFFQFLLEPATLVIIVCLALFAVSHLLRKKTAPVLLEGNSYLVSCDVALALSFLAMPLFALTLAFVTKGPFVDRYLLSTVIGVALLVAFGAARFDGSKWVPLTIATILAFSLVIDPLRVLKHRLAGVGEVLFEPSTLLRLSTTPGDPMAPHDALRAAEQSALPIVVMSSMDYAFLFEYALPQMKSRFWYISPDATELIGRILRLERQWCGQAYNLDYTRNFLAGNHRLFLYGRPPELFSFLSLNNQVQVHSILSRTDSSTDAHFLLDAEIKNNDDDPGSEGAKNKSPYEHKVR
jgi:hypothetical protein